MNVWGWFLIILGFLFVVGQLIEILRRNRRAQTPGQFVTGPPPVRPSRPSIWGASKQSSFVRLGAPPQRGCRQRRFFVSKHRSAVRDFGPFQGLGVGWA
jgi:hypothetical protein